MVNPIIFPKTGYTLSQLNQYNVKIQNLNCPNKTAFLVGHLSFLSILIPAEYHIESGKIATELISFHIKDRSQQFYFSQEYGNFHFSIPSRINEYVEIGSGISEILMNASSNKNVIALIYFKEFKLGIQLRSDFIIQTQENYENFNNTLLAYRTYAENICVVFGNGNLSIFPKNYYQNQGPLVSYIRQTVFVNELASFYFAISQYPHRKTEGTIKHLVHSNGIMNGAYHQLCSNFVNQAKKNPILAAKYLLYSKKFDFTQFQYLGSTLIASGCRNVSVEIDVERLIQHCFSDLPVKMFDQAKNKFQHF